MATNWTGRMPVPLLTKAKVIDPLTGRVKSPGGAFTAEEQRLGGGRAAGVMAPLLTGRAMGVPRLYADAMPEEEPQMTQRPQMRRRADSAVATYGADDGQRIDAHTYGDTFAKVNQGHSGALSPSYGGEHGFAGLDEFYENNPDTPTARQRQEEMDFVPVTHRAYGGPVPHGKPFIAGDVQRDGKPNPELVLPTPQGVHVIPLKNLKGKGEKGMMVPRLRKKGGPVPIPKLAYGTVEDLGMVQMPVLNRRTGDVVNASRVAFDDAGRMVGVGTGTGSVPTADVAENTDVRVNAAADVPVPMMRPRLAPVNFAALRQRRQEVENPEGIVAGVTPRAPLMAASPSPMTGASREELQVPRLRRQVLRAAKADPRLALGLLDRRNEAERASAAGQAAGARTVFLEQGRNQRAQAGLDAGNARAEAAAKAKADADAVAMNFKLADESRKAAEFAQSINPDVNVVPVEGTNYAVPFAGGKAMGTVPMKTAPTVEMLQMPNTEMFYPAVNGKPDLARPFQAEDSTLMMPQPFSSPMVPNIPTPVTVRGGGALKPVAKTSKGVDRTKTVKELAGLYKLMADPMMPEEAKKRLQMEIDRMGVDLDGDGVPDAMPGAAGGAASVGAAVAETKDQALKRLMGKKG